jgi:hypothetical protein
MRQLLALLSAVALAAGCQSQGQNPFSSFGPATVPPPGAQAPGTLPYYPPGTPGGPPSVTVPPNITMPPSATAPPNITIPGGTSFTPTTSQPPARTNISVTPPTITSGALSSTFAADPADRQPIRVVEAAPAVKDPIQAFANTPGAARQPIEVSQAPKNGGYAPAATAPAYNRTRGYPTPTPPANTIPATNGQSTGGFRTDPSVAPAGFTTGGSAFVQPATAADGQWRSR